MPNTTMTSQTLPKGNDGKLSLQMGVDGKVQLLWKGDDGKQHLFPQTTEDGKVQRVDPLDSDAIVAGKLAATQNGVEFMAIVVGYQIIFSNAAYYHLLIVGQDSNGYLMTYFTTVLLFTNLPTIVGGSIAGVVLLFTGLNFPSSETLQVGNGGKLSLQMAIGEKVQVLFKGDDGKEQLLPQTTEEGKVQFVGGSDPDAIEAGTLAATQNGVQFISIGVGFKITFSRGAFHHLLILAEDSNGDKTTFFTVVETFYKPLVLLFTPCELPFPVSTQRRLLTVSEGEGKVETVDPNDPKVIGAAKLAADQEGVEFQEVALGYQITFSGAPDGAFYYLLILAKDSNGDVKLFFAVVETYYVPVVLLVTPVELNLFKPTLPF